MMALCFSMGYVILSYHFWKGGCSRDVPVCENLHHNVAVNDKTHVASWGSSNNTLVQQYLV